MTKPKVFTFTTANNVSYDLTEKEKKFCEIYCEFGVSGVDAVYQAGYNPAKADTAYSIASENLRKPKVLAYIGSLYKEFKFTDEDVMREHRYLIMQHYDLSTKARAIDLYYKKSGAYSQGKQETPAPRPYDEWSDEELQAKIDEYYTKHYKPR
jgi:phage terminase small subunit